MGQIKLFKLLSLHSIGQFRAIFTDEQIQFMNEELKNILRQNPIKFANKKFISFEKKVVKLLQQNIIKKFDFVLKIYCLFKVFHITFKQICCLLKKHFPAIFEKIKLHEKRMDFMFRNIQRQLYILKLRQQIIGDYDA